jgi:hypothetical protein
MAQMQISGAERAPMGGAIDPNTLFQLGLRYSTESSSPEDRVAAHKWFNIAAMQGKAEAARLRQEIAAEMSAAEIAAAQRAARDWITRH